jgi:uncharacterized membrane protein
MAKNLILLPLLLVAACAMEEEEAIVGAPQTEYSALGQEPGWALRIDRDRIAYTGDYGETRITVARPAAIPTTTGTRYQTSRITVDITPGRCNDAMSGRGFEDMVTVIAAGRTVRGCGGARRTDYDT